MKRRSILLAVSLALAGFGAAHAQVDLSTLDARMPGSRSQVLVLGSVHLHDMPKDFKRDSLQPVIDRLAAFNPQIITIEDISGEACDLAARHPAVYGDVQSYCSDLSAARAATGLDLPAAIAEVRKALADWPARPAAAQRRHLAALFLAAGEDVSALVQWLQLPSGERHAGDGLDDALVTSLEKSAKRNDESAQIAARLAARLGLPRVFAIDDHTGDNIEVGDEAAYVKAIQRAWDSTKAQTAPLRAHEDELTRQGEMLALYRYINRPDVLRTRIDSDFAAALQDDSPQHFGRLYVAGWETRNLRMVANIRAAFRDRPGARVLSIVGASHKPWFDGLLGQTQGVEIVDAEQILK